MASVTSFVGALSLPKLYAYLSKKRETDAGLVCQEKIQKTELRMQKVIIAIDMLLVIIETEFDADHKYNPVIQKVKVLLYEDDADSV